MGRTGRAVRHGGFQERKGLEGENVGRGRKRPQSGRRVFKGENWGRGKKRRFEGEKVGGELGDRGRWGGGRVGRKGAEGGRKRGLVRRGSANRGRGRSP